MARVAEHEERDPRRHEGIEAPRMHLEAGSRRVGRPVAPLQLICDRSGTWFSGSREAMSIVLDQLLKRYEGHAVVNNVSLEVTDGEFFVLLGPSGSGKSTLLRMIAGLVDGDSGRVVLHGRDVTRLPPQKRGVGLVFQHYALFRHMSVARNIEFPLRVRKVAAADRRSRRDELLELVGLAGLGRRLPAHLSGGQQQRVALARAL